MNPSSQAGWAYSVAPSAAQAHRLAGPAREAFSHATGLEVGGDARTGRMCWYREACDFGQRVWLDT